MFSQRTDPVIKIIIVNIIIVVRYNYVSKLRINTFHCHEIHYFVDKIYNFLVVFLVKNQIK